MVDMSKIKARVPLTLDGISIGWAEVGYTDDTGLVMDGTVISDDPKVMALFKQSDPISIFVPKPYIEHPHKCSYELKGARWNYLVFQCSGCGSYKYPVKTAFYKALTTPRSSNG